MKFIISLLLNCMSLLSLSGCMFTHYQAGFFKKRTSDTYVIKTGWTPGGSENAAYRGAMEICKRDHQSGFKVISESQNGELIDLSFKCEGSIDSYLETKHKNSPGTFTIWGETLDGFTRYYFDK